MTDGRENDHHGGGPIVRNETCPLCGKHTKPHKATRDGEWTTERYWCRRCNRAWTVGVVDQTRPGRRWRIWPLDRGSSAARNAAGQGARVNAMSTESVPATAAPNRSNPNRRNGRSDHAQRSPGLPNQPERNTPMTTDPTDHALTPEVAAVTEKLDALPGELVTDRLRSTVLTAAFSATSHRHAAEATTAAQAAVQAAIAAGDMPAAIREAGALAALAQVRSIMAPPEVDTSVVADAMERAAEYVRLAESAIPSVPVVAYTAELAAWRSLPANVQAGSEPPVNTEADQAAQAVVDAIGQARRPVTATVTAWRRALDRSPDALDYLAAAAGAAEMCRSHAADATQAVAAVQAANEARARAGLTWTAPVGVSTPALVFLTK